jgi:hypothetical protein
MKEINRQRKYLKKVIDNLPPQILAEIRDLTEFIVIRRLHIDYKTLLKSDDVRKRNISYEADELHNAE